MITRRMRSCGLEHPQESIVHRFYLVSQLTVLINVFIMRYWVLSKYFFNPLREVVIFKKHLINLYNNRFNNDKKKVMRVTVLGVSNQAYKENRSETDNKHILEC